MAGADDLRVSDEQRDRAAQEIREHYAAGRLTDDELGDRVQAVYSARTEQELRKLLSDLPKLPASPAQQKAELVARRNMLQRRMIQEAGSGLGVFAICTGVWFVSGGHHGHGAFWPIIVLIVCVAPLLRNGWRLYGPAPELDQVERELDARRRKNEMSNQIRSGAHRRADQIQSEAHRRAARRSRRHGGPF